MFRFEQTDYGLRLTVLGALDPSAVAFLEAETKRLIAKQDGHFSVLVDAREFIPASVEITAILQHCEEMALKAGLQRMAFILKSPVVKGHVQQIAHLSGAIGISRYVDSSQVDNAEQVALDWLISGIEPDKNPATCGSSDSSVSPR